MNRRPPAPNPLRTRVRSSRAARSVLALAFGLTGCLALVGPAAEAAPAPAAADRGRAPVVSASVERAVARMAKGAAPSVRVVVTLDAARGTGPAPSPSAIRSTRSAVLADLPDASYDVVASFSRVPAVSLEVNEESLEALSRDQRVVAVNEDHVISTEMSEANAITGANDAHALGFTGAGTTVAVIDTGVDSNAGVVHSGLADDLVGQACFRTENDCIGGAGSAEDQHSHGTHVAGIITGPQGVAPDASFYALKVFTTSDTSDTNILNALNHVITLNTTTPGTVDLVNMSLGGANYADEAACNADNAAYLDAFSSLNAQGVTVFVSTGNDASTTTVSGPGCVTGAVGVGSTGDATYNLGFSNCTDNGAVDKVSCFSNATPVQGPGELVDLLAPGCLITSLGLNESTSDNKCGTSMAAPYAAGAAAVALQAAADGGGSLTPAQVENLLEDTGVQVSDYRLAGGSPTFPRVDVLAAVGSLGLDAPGNLHVVSNTSTDVSLAWTAVAEATEYRVYRSVDGAPVEEVGTTTDTALTDVGVPCGPLTYTARSFDGALPSLASNEVLVTARACPATPTDLTLTVVDTDTHELAWSDGNVDETSVVLQRRTPETEFVDHETFGPGSTFSTSDTVATCGLVEYRAVAVRGGDRSLPSDVVRRAMCAPANDNLADALVVTPGAVPSLQTETVPGIAYATEEPSDPAFSCKFGGAAPGYHGVWYSITPTETARVTISTAGTTILDPGVGNLPDTLLAIYDATPSTISQFACNDDVSGSVYTSQVTRNLTAGTTYYVHSALWSDLPDTTPGSLVTSFSWLTPVPTPANDLWPAAAEISASPYTLSVADAQNATTSGGDPAHPCRDGASSVGSHTLWWTITPEFDGTLDLSTASSSGSMTDTILSVWTGSPGSFANVACNDDIGGGNLRSSLTDVAVTGGTTYSIEVSRWSNTATETAGTVVLDATYDASPGVTLSDTSVAVDEDGTDDTYTVQLIAQPTADVTVAVAGDEDCAVDPQSLTFTTADWATPQTVTVSGVPDDVVEGDHTCAVTHTVTSTDAAYDGIAVPDVDGTVTDALLTEIAITTPPDGAEYVQGAAVTADYVCSDNRGGAGIMSCVGDVADGASIDTSTLGAHDFTVTLTDVYGTDSEVTSTYTVVAAPPSPVRRPDARIGVGSGPLAGNNIYNTLTGQTKAASARRGKTVTFRVSLQNDGNVAEQLRMTGARSARGFSVRYVGPTGANLTSTVTGSGFLTPSLAPGATYVVKVVVKVGRSAKRSLSRDVVVRSSAQPSVSDTVRFITKRKGG